MCLLMISILRKKDPGRPFYKAFTESDLYISDQKNFSEDVRYAF